MNFLKTQSKQAIIEYTSYLKNVAALSTLFSESDKPYLHYRVAENIFCKAFSAKNWARGDIAFDATIDGFGIGIKTFLLAGPAKLEKVAEFNSHSAILRSLKGQRKLEKLVELRNERILFADRTCNVKKRIYHCIGRESSSLKIFETSYDLIDESSLKLISETDTALKFRDKYNEYSFNFSKSTIFKKFIIPEDSLIVPIDILEDPLSLLSNLTFNKKTGSSILTYSKAEFKGKSTSLQESISIPKSTLVKKKFDDYVILPLYSPNYKKAEKKEFVPEKSQLNQWNAGGRLRDVGEVYIPIPADIHKIKPKFFPGRDVTFSLSLPSGEVLNAKVCQDGNKALMTNPNNALADWILYSALGLRKGELLTYSKLLKVDIDSVRIIKDGPRNFRIEFAKLDSYENFISENMQ
jgi:hypothetical protein